MRLMLAFLACATLAAAGAGVMHPQYRFKVRTAAGTLTHSRDWTTGRVLGREDPLLARAALDGMVDDRRELLATDPPDADLARLRLHTATGRPLGSEAFLRNLEGASGRVLLPQKRGPQLRKAGEKWTQTAIR